MARGGAGRGGSRRQDDRHSYGRSDGSEEKVTKNIEEPRYSHKGNLIQEQ